jgi:hypothetical protein
VAHGAAVALEEVVVEATDVEVDVVDPVVPVAAVLVVVVTGDVVVVAAEVLVVEEPDEGDELQAERPAARARATSRYRARIAGSG